MTVDMVQASTQGFPTPINVRKKRADSVSTTASNTTSNPDENGPITLNEGIREDQVDLIEVLRAESHGMPDKLVSVQSGVANSSSKQNPADQAKNQAAPVEFKNMSDLIGVWTDKAGIGIAPDAADQAENQAAPVEFKNMSDLVGVWTEKARLDVVA